MQCSRSVTFSQELLNWFHCHAYIIDINASASIPYFMVISCMNTSKEIRNFQSASFSRRLVFFANKKQTQLFQVTDLCAPLHTARSRSPIDPFLFAQFERKPRNRLYQIRQLFTSTGIKRQKCSYSNPHWIQTIFLIGNLW